MVCVLDFQLLDSKVVGKRANVTIMSETATYLIISHVNERFLSAVSKFLGQGPQGETNGTKFAGLFSTGSRP